MPKRSGEKTTDPPTGPNNLYQPKSPYFKRNLHLSLNHCPKCKSDHILPRNIAARAGGTIGTVAGAASGIGGAIKGARIGRTAGMIAPPAGPLVGTIAGAVLGGIFGGILGCEVGTTLGKAVDKNILNNYRCAACGHTFSDSSTSPVSSGRESETPFSHEVYQQ